MIALLLCIVGLGASGTLLAAYTGCAELCGAGGGCDVVRASQYAEILGVKTPILGLLFFAVALAFALARARRLLVGWAAVGAGAGLIFVGIQGFVLHAFCAFCLVVDGAALALFAAAVLDRREAPARLGARIGLAVVGAAVAAAPLATIGRCEAPPAVVSADMPDPIAREQRPGVATIVEFIDFECPACRRLNAILHELLPAYGNKVRIVRKHVPLTKIHPHAMNAAQAACCADEAGAGEAMAQALFTIPPEELTSEGCESLAAKVGVDLAGYRACMASSRPLARVEADLADARSMGLRSVPVFYVGEEKLMGAQPAEVIRAAIDRQLARR